VCDLVIPKKAPSKTRQQKFGNGCAPWRGFGSSELITLRRRDRLCGGKEILLARSRRSASGSCIDARSLGRICQAAEDECHGFAAWNIRRSKSDTQVEMREAAVVEKFTMDPVEEAPRGRRRSAECGGLFQEPPEPQANDGNGR
jgi:hypothetical protein